MLEVFAGAMPKIAVNAFVHERAVLIGDVSVGAESSIWPNTTLRADDSPIVIGDASSIQDNVVIHATQGQSKTTVGSRVTVGHGAILHGCTIGDDCLIGMGSIILDNAVVESGAFVAAGTLIPPGKWVRTGEFVMGNPFRVVRACTDADYAWIEFSWKAYVQRARQYLQKGEQSPAL